MALEQKTMASAKRQQLDLFFRSLPIASATAFGLAIIITIFFKDSQVQPFMKSWLMAMISTLVIRGIIITLYYRSANNPKRQKTLINLSLFTITLTATLWGALAYIVFPLVNQEEKMIILILLTGIIGGAVTSMSYHIPHIVAFVVIIIGSLITGLYRANITFFNYATLFYLVYLLFLMQTAKIIYNNSLNNIKLTIEATENSLKLKAANEQAENAVASRSAFLANMSHEIRTPMNGIIGLARIALNSGLKEPLATTIGNIKKSADHLLGLLNDILDTSKIEAGELNINCQIFSLDELLEGIVSTLAFPAEEKGLQLSIDAHHSANTHFNGDELRLRQILINLTGNAIKFTEKGSIEIQVQQSAVAAKPEQIELQFRVKDSGIGIPEEFKADIFSKFQQGDDSTSRRFGGTGLGLSISKQLVSMMGGKIWCEDNQDGDGTTFFFTVTLSKQKQSDMPQKAISTKQIITGKKILVVEDNEINSTVARAVLEADQHIVLLAVDGLAALEILTQEKFDLIFMDIQMPVLDGILTTETIRQCEQSAPITASINETLIEILRLQLANTHTPIIAMTANAISGDREKCLQKGMNEYITKPFDPEKVRAIIHALCVE